MNSLQEAVASDFFPGSTLSEHFPDYSYRPEQVALAAEIAETIEVGGSLLAEAGTGTGKTLAYLVPAIKCGRKVLISTHTKALQDQLMYKDLPGILKALSADRDVILLKGRANYLCPHRLKRKLGDHRMEKEVRQLLSHIQEWSVKSRDGDLSFLDIDIFDAGIGGMVTSTAEQCLGRTCPEWNACPLMRARARARDADIVIVNHSLLLADASLKSGEFGEVLPEFDTYILDEAQALPDLASQHFGLQLSSHRFVHWANDMQAVLEELGDEIDLQRAITRLMKHLLHAYARNSLKKVAAIWQEMETLASSRAERSQDLAALARRAVEISQDIRAIMEPETGFVAWSDGKEATRRYYLAPIETGPLLKEHIWSKGAAFVLLSATLRVSGSFVYARQRLGITPARESVHPSPFDYTTQALIYVPARMPEPRHCTYHEAMLAEMESLLSASHGRAFVLFTSHRMLQRIAPQLAQRLPWKVLIQGRHGSRDRILSEFRGDTNSILCGTRSFWEGVDVPGESLSLVIIDKLPFAPPDDPLLNERIRACDNSGGNGFWDIQVPEAVAILKQGLGRLIRSHTDRGVIAVLDSRIHSRSYGKEVLRNFPPAPLSRDIRDVRRFFGVQ